MANFIELYESISNLIDSDNKKISNGVRLNETESHELSNSIQLLPYLTEYRSIASDLNYALSNPDTFDTSFVTELKERQKVLEVELNAILKAQTYESVSNFIIEIRAGAGGEEAALFVKNIFNAYTKYLKNNRYNFEILDISESDSGGFSFISFEIQSNNAYELLKNEGGVHRVQRVPKTESSGRIHTSTISIALLPISKKSTIEIDPKDLRIDVYRSSGNGGQSVNTTDSAVRITYLPTGMVVTCQNTKSQIKNKEMALKVLQARLEKEQSDNSSQSLNSIRNKQIQNSDRSEKIRTYNYLQDRITDHRVKLDFSNVEKFMEGDIEPYIQKINIQLEALDLDN